MTLEETILERMPYRRPFLFVDGFDCISENGAEGHYRFKEDEFFYDGHFPGNPITPGVILTETMAQIGLVGLGIYLIGLDAPDQPGEILFSEANVAFTKKVGPRELVRVRSQKIYFRLGKLKCQVEMTNESGDRVSHGTLSGMIVGRQPT